MGRIFVKDRQENMQFLEVFVIDLHHHKNQKEILYEWLDQKEKKQALKFKFTYLQDNFILSHALLRCLVGKQLMQHPREIVFSYTSLGKPFIADAPLHFNMSHSQHMALYAFSREGEVGVDIEYNRCSVEDLPISALPLFMQEEILFSPPSKQQELFYKKWVQMEAYLKATGIGLYNSISDIQKADFSKWNFYEIPLYNGFTGAVASLKQLILKINAEININTPPTTIGIL